MSNICNICGANYVYKESKWICPACDAIKPEEISNEETMLLYAASQKLRLAAFADAEELYADIISKYPADAEAYWGLLLSKYGIKYEQDYDGKMLPTCYATSIVSFLLDENYLKALQFASNDQKQYYAHQAETIEKIRITWVEKSQKELPYDVFISYKDSDLENGIKRTKDSYEAYEIYTQLQKKGYRVFFSRESLKDKVGELKYEPYIFNALNTAKIMLVYGTNPEYISSTWIKNEWLRFYKLIKVKQKQDNSLVVIYKGFNPAVLPRPLNTMQCMDAQGLTFLQDLLSKVKNTLESSNRNIPTLERKIIKNVVGKKAAKLDGIKPIEAGTALSPKEQQTFLSTVEVRQIGTFTAPIITPDESNKISTAKVFASKGLFDDAKQILNGIILENPRNSLALYYLLMADTNCKEISAFINKIGEFKNFSLLRQYLDCADKENGEIMLALFAREAKKRIDNKNITKFIEIYSQIASYSSSKCLTLHKEALAYSLELVKIKKISDAKAIANISIAYLGQEADEYVNILHNVVSTYIAVELYDDAKEYFNKLLEVDGDGLNTKFYALFIEYQANTRDKVFSEIEKRNKYTAIDSIIQSSSKAIAEEFIYVIIKYIYRKIGSNYLNIEKWIEVLCKYNFDSRDDLIKASIDNCINGDPIATESSFNKILKYLNKEQVNDYIAYSMRFAAKCLGHNNFELAEKYYNEILKYEAANKNALWGKIFCEIKATGRQLWENADKITGFDTVETLLSYCIGDQDKNSALKVLIDACIDCVIKNNTIKDESNVFSVFEKLISYIPKTLDSELLSYLEKMANACKMRSFFKQAEKYYAMMLGVDSSEHKAYWGLLQAKLSCKNDEDLAKQPVIISDIAEFNNAIAAAGSNDKAISDYIDVKVRQSTWIQDQKRIAIAKKKRKKIYTIMAAAMCFVLIITSGSLGGVSYYRANNKPQFDVSSVDEGYTVYSGKYYNPVDLVIPYDHDGQPVVEIADNAFKDETTLKTMVLPNSIVRIGNNAFSGCTNLTSITFADVSEEKVAYAVENTDKTVKSNLSIIGDNAFEGCNSLRSFTIPSGVTSIGQRAFANCGLQSVTVPDMTIEIKGSAFEGCTSLKEVVLGEKVKTIGKKAFANTVIKTINIPASVEIIEEEAFANCTRLSSIQISDNARNPQGWDKNWLSNVTADIEYYYTITYDCQGGTLHSSTDTKVVYDKYYLLRVPIRNGYTFNGWYASANGEGTKYTNVQGNSTSKWTEYNGRTLFAHWLANDNILRFDGNGASGTTTMSSITVKTDETVTLPNNTFARSGYEFDGWSTTRNGEVEFADSSSYLMGTESEYILNAVWKPIKYAISYNLYGGINSTENPSTYTIEDTITLSNASKLGYDFIGWYSESSYDTKVESIGDRMGVMSLYAKFAIHTYTITYELNGGTNSVDNPTTYTIDDCPLTLADAISSEEFFDCWCTLNDVERGIKISVINDDLLGNYTLYAFFNGTFGLQYSLNNDGVSYSVSGYNGEPTAVSVPNIHNGFPVSAIKTNAFRDISSLLSVSLASNVISIGQYAFSGCSGLTSITIPNSVTSIGQSAFGDCCALQSITLPFIGTAKGDTTNTCFGEIFGACNLDVPSTLKTVVITGGASIGDSAFSGCSGLTSITIPDSVTSIGEYAFNFCSGLISITIPDSVTSIGKHAFNACSGLTKVCITDLEAWLGISFGNYTLGNYSTNPLQYAKNLYINNVLATDIVIPDNVTSIGQIAFVCCTGLTTITISDSVTSIGSNAFYGCSALQSITLPFIGAAKDGTSSTHFGYLFGASSSEDNSSCVPSTLKTVVITGGASIGASAFYGCSGLTSITIPDSVTSIGEYAFNFCSGLISITIPNNVTSIERNAFYGCSSLTSIIIPASVTTMEHAFARCTGLNTINCVALSKPTGWDENWNMDCSATVVWAYVMTVTTNDTYDYTFTGVGDVVELSSYKSTNTNVIVPSTIDGKTVVSFGNIFQGKPITSITVPSSITSINLGAFNDCTSLVSVTLPFVGATLDGTINTNFGYIFGTTSYTGNATCMPSSLRTVSITGGTNISWGAFQNCVGLTSISIPNSVTSIGESAFHGCTNLNSLTLPFVGTSRIADSAGPFGMVFGDNGSSWAPGTVYQKTSYSGGIYCFIPQTLRNVIITDATELPQGAFSGCDFLQSITLPDCLGTIKSYTFYGCGITSITLPTMLVSIESNAFQNCAIQQINIPANVNSIGTHAFFNCSALSNVEIGAGVNKIDESAFRGCNQLERVKFIDTTTWYKSLWNQTTTYDSQIDVSNPAQNAQLILSGYSDVYDHVSYYKR